MSQNTNLAELREALDALSPAGLTYQEWLSVGMGLKDAGLPVTEWEAWSARDSGRYHPGECARKWAGFRGSETPVTASSIFALARAHGWAGPAGQALDWGDEIKTDGVVVDAKWLEPKELNIPDEWDPAAQLIQYLRALFEPEEYVAYVTKVFMDKDKLRPTKGCFDRTSEQLIAELETCGGDIGKVLGDYDPAVGAWICFNPVNGNGRRNDDVTDYRYALVESDDMELEQQAAIIRQLELPCAALVYSGGKSLHAIVKVDAGSLAEYKKRVDYLYTVCQKNGLSLDQQNRNPSRLSRMPGVVRNGRKQYLLETDTGRSCWEEWVEFIESATDDLPEVENDLADELPELAPPLIDGVLRQGHKMLLAGPSKAGKSFALIELAICIAEGLPWMGFACTQGRVLYVNLELDRASCLHRFADVRKAMGAPRTHPVSIWNLRGHAVPMDKLAPKLIRRAQKQNYLAIILDPIYKVITGDENSADQMAAFCNQFDKVCTALGCAVIYCHHHSKGLQGQKRSMDRASGSGVFARDPDALLDMIELTPTEAIRTARQNHAAAKAAAAALDAAGKADAYSRDDACSRSRMLAICAGELPPAEARKVEAAADAAGQQAAKCTAWRIEGTLREFAPFAPLNLWFDYPLHVLDTGALEDLEPDGDPKSLSRKAAATRWGTKNKQKADLENAFEASVENGEASVYDMAEYLDLKPDTVRRRIKADGGFWYDDGKIGRKKTGESSA